MAKRLTKSPTRPSAPSDWTKQLDQLLSDIEAWAERSKWLVRSDEVMLQERDLGTYCTRVLTLQLPKGRLRIEPIARFVSGADGRVDLYSWPDLNRVRLLRIGNKWRVRTDSGLDWPKPWNRETFIRLARELTAAA